MSVYVARNLLSRMVQSRARVTFLSSFTRKLSTNEVATALRPFYFKVHPDLFGLYPQERAVNEESLKMLSEYLSRLQQQNQRSHPISLLFYVKQPDFTQNSADVTGPVRGVRLSLLSDNIRETVSSILKACDLPLDYVNSIPIAHKVYTSKAEVGTEATIDPSFYAFYANPNLQDEETYVRPKENPVDFMRKWLEKNAKTAREKVMALEPIKEETEKLKQVLIKDYGLVDVRWECGWSLAQFRACLCGFIQLYQAHRSELRRLDGYSLVFANQNGLCIQGDVILRKDDVPNHWLPLLRSVHTHEAILNRIPSRENHLSSLLGGIQIVRQKGGTIVMAQDYHVQLKRVIGSVKSYLREHPEIVVPEPLDDLELVIGNEAGSNMVSPSGKIIVPSSSPGFLIVNFLVKNVMNARRVKMEYMKKESVNTKFIDICVAKLRLKDLTRDNNVTLEKMETCCRDLVSCYDTGALSVDLEGCVVKVASFYSVMSDGEMHIPWNWNELTF